MKGNTYTKQNELSNTKYYSRSENNPNIGVTWSPLQSFFEDYKRELCKVTHKKHCW